MKEGFFSVNNREKPSEYIYEETEILNYAALEKRLQKIEEDLKNLKFEETDPTVPDWAKQPNKPRYTATEVGALSSTETVRQLAQKQDKSNLVTSINESSVDSTYPSTRAVYEYVGEEFARLVGGAPDALNTIEELAAAFNNNPDILDTLNASIINKQDKTDSVGVKTTQGGEIFNDYQNNTASREYSHAEGVSTKAYGRGSHAEGENAEALGDYSHAEGRMTRTVSRGSHSEGDSTIAGNPTATLSNDISELSTYEQQVPGAAAHAEGIGSIANKSASHAEGFKTQALGEASHSEGQNTTASSKGAHAEGLDTIAEGDYSHAEGCSNGNIMTIASGKGSHAEGIGNWAIGKGSHAEGNNNSASKDYSHAEGDSTTASGTASHTEGKGTIANSSFQHVQGKYNIEDTANKYAHIVGNGSSVNARSNAHTVDWDGNAEFQGDVKAKACGSNSPISLVDAANALVNKITTPLIAEVGQILEVESVDENGVPTKWKAANQTSRIEYITHNAIENQVINPEDKTQTFTLKSVGYIDNKRRKLYKNSYFQIYLDDEEFLINSEEFNDGVALIKDKILFQFRELNVLLDTKVDRKTGLADFIFKFSDVLTAPVTVSAYYKQKIYHQLDENLIPSTVPVILSAAKGQFLKVKSVDENGKPITWEVSDKPTYTAEEVGALSADTEIPSIEGLATEEYVDNKITDLVNSAPETLDTIGELATSFNENKEVVDALNEAITNKANASDLTAHTDDTTIHVTAEEKAAWNSVDAIIDVIALPTEDINEDSFYRLLTGKLVINQFLQNMYKCYCVETLPEVGEPATNIEQTDGSVYYNLTDGELYGYVDDVLSMGLSVPAGWYIAGVLLSALGYDYNGVITDIMDDPGDDAFRLLLEYEIYSYKENKWTSHKAIGRAGAGASAEVFNHPSNKATGDASHAEGYSSHAEGDYSHAEGTASHAEGYSSHAEGDCSHAEGDYSHAEGWYSHAEGHYSHAEGYYSHAEEDYSHAEGFCSYAKGFCSHAEGNEAYAEGDCSHAEGLNTVASAGYSHAQGKYNIEDTEKKYAHIVGNGENNSNRSNAHTLDWQGNAEFQGDVLANACGGENPISLISLFNDFADLKSRFDAIINGNEVAY